MVTDKASVCALQQDPAAYDHKLIEVSAVVSHGFEHFTLSDTRCAAPFGIWLEYGGKTYSDTIYCCGVTAGAAREGTLVIEGIAVPLVEDALFRRFDARIRVDRETRFSAQLIGRFFAGTKQEAPNGPSWGGYGHIGCCSLLAIQQVLALDGR